MLTVTDQFKYMLSMNIMVKWYNKTPHTSLILLSPYDVYKRGKKNIRLFVL